MQRNGKVTAYIFSIIFFFTVILFGGVSFIQLCKFYIHDEVDYNEWNVDLGNKFETDITTNFYNKIQFVNFNGAMRNLLGQQEMNGVVKLDNGYLCSTYSQCSDETLEVYAERVSSLNAFLKEKVKPAQALIVVTAFLGSLLVIKPTGLNMEAVPALIGFSGGVAAGAAYTCVRKLSSCGEKGPFIVAFFSGFSCLVTLPFLIFNYHPMSVYQIVMLLLAGASAAGGQFTITAAYSHAPAKEISVYDYSQIIFSAVLGFFLFGQVPDVWSWVGYGIIIAMAVAMFLYNNRS